ncbi:uncharacterized protein LOC114481223 isoform X2 [Gouania willdenowi]|uniref:uncharacterized protein LOC114481223 isoform X2 n=1 Tax=Gouania willdenowi TaxID=441366 RepID=UPI00105603C8|nr:uncharacterized protein LOC114481223 isoform X2 [Gouania willdenowi]
MTLTKEPGLRNECSLTEQSEGSGSVTVSPERQDILTHVSSKPRTKSPELPSLQLLSDLDKLKLDTIDPPVQMLINQRFKYNQNSNFKDELYEDECPKKNTCPSPRLHPSKEIRNTGFTGLTHFQMSIQVEPEATSVSPDVARTLSCHIHRDNSVLPFELPSILKSPQENCEETGTLQSLGFYLDMYESTNHLETALDTCPSVATNSQSNIVDLTNEENHRAGILQNQEGHKQLSVFDDSEETFTMSYQDQLLQKHDAIQLETNHCDEVSPQFLSDFTSETITTIKHFSFEEPMPCTSSEDFETSSDKQSLKYDGHYSDDYNSHLDFQYVAPKSNSVSPKPGMTSSTSLEGYDTPSGKADVYSLAGHTPITSESFGGVCNGPESPTFENSDQENYFDCKQASSDFSETDHDEPETHAFSGQRKLSVQGSEMGKLKVLLSSGSEDYEDASFVHEHFDYSKNKDLLNKSQASDEEFYLCETSHQPCVYDTGTFDDNNKSLARSDELVDLPAESVTEEKYKDENGHVVVKKVTRKIIRKYVSADGVEHEGPSSHGTSEGTIAAADGAGYSKVFKRTVLRSEGDHTEVTFAECEGSSSSRQEVPDGCRISHTEKITVVDGVRTVTHQGDPSLASDLPSAHSDFKEALGYINDCSRAELPHVVEKEIISEDGTVVQRAHMRKGQTLSQAVLKEAGQPEQVLVEQKDIPREVSEPSDLRRHLHHFFHHYYDEEDKVEEKE